MPRGRPPSVSTIEDLEEEIFAAGEDELLDDLLTPIPVFSRKNGRNSWPVLKAQFEEERSEAQFCS